MKKQIKRTVEGTKDVLFRECRIRRDTEKKISRMFSLRGFNEVLTPGIEYFELFGIENASIPAEEMFKTTDNNGRLIVLRPDSTLPIARLTASRLQGMKKPIRLFYNQSIFRNRPDLSGRNRETAQIGTELIGAAGLRADLEMISTAFEAIASCIPDFRLEIGHAALFHSLYSRLELPEEKKEAVRRCIETKNYATLNELLEDSKDSHIAEAIQALPRLFGGKEILKKAEQYCFDEESKAMLSYVNRLYSALAEMGMENQIIMDLGLVQKNDYYTGVVFSAYTQEYGDVLLEGGRYDNLLGKLGEPLPAIGFSVNIDALTKILLANDWQCKVQQEDRILVHGDCGYEIAAQKMTNAYLAQGRPCELSMFDSIQASIEYAKVLGIRKILSIGKEKQELLITEEPNEAD